MVIGNGIVSGWRLWTTLGSGEGRVSQNVQVPRCHRVTYRNSFLEHRMVWRNYSEGRAHRHRARIPPLRSSLFYRSGLQLPSSNSVLSANGPHYHPTTPFALSPPSSARQTRLRTSARTRLRTVGRVLDRQRFFLLPGGQAEGLWGARTPELSMSAPAPMPQRGRNVH